MPGAQPVPFGPGDLLSVSEVGIAVPDVVGTADRLTDAGIGRYPDGSATFSPAGHIDGMLILVSRGRTWFPTSDRVVAEPPVTVVAQAGAASPGVLPGRYELAPGRVLVVRPIARSCDHLVITFARFSVSLLRSLAPSRPLGETQSAATPRTPLSTPRSSG